MLEMERMPGRDAAVAVDVPAAAALGAARGDSRCVGFTRQRRCDRVDENEDSGIGKFLVDTLFPVACCSSIEAAATFPARNLVVNPERRSFETCLGLCELPAAFENDHSREQGVAGLSSVGWACW
jgi:hypothetical protein